MSRKSNAVLEAEKAPIQLFGFVKSGAGLAHRKRKYVIVLVPNENSPLYLRGFYIRPAQADNLAPFNGPIVMKWLSRETLENKENGWRFLRR